MMAIRLIEAVVKSGYTAGHETSFWGESMLNRWIHLVMVALFLSMIPAWEVGAAVGVRLPLPDLARSSSLVVRGKVISSESYKDGKTHRIMTRHQVEVGEVWRGKRVSKVTVLTMGGEVGDLGQWIPGEAVLEQGGEYVLFLQSAGGGYAVTGMAQGLFRVELEPGAKVPLLVRDLSGIRFVGESVPAGRRVKGALEKLKLEPLKKLCRSIAEEAP